MKRSEQKWRVERRRRRMGEEGYVRIVGDKESERGERGIREEKERGER